MAGINELYIEYRYKDAFNINTHQPHYSTWKQILVLYCEQ